MPRILADDPEFVDLILRTMREAVATIERAGRCRVLHLSATRNPKTGRLEVNSETTPMMSEPNILIVPR